MKASMKYHGRVTAVVAALWMAACGGGGGDGDTTAVAPADAPAVGQGPVAGTPAPAPAPTPAAVTLNFAAVPNLPADQYHWVATNETGTVMAATTITTGGGQILISTDGGATFTPSSAPSAGWISLDMTPDGSRMVAVAFNGGMFLSTDTGATWTRIDASINLTQSLPYESVTISDDGARIVAVTLNGPAFFSSNANTATPTFTQSTLVGSAAAFTDAFRAVDSSASGTTVVAASHNGALYISGDGDRQRWPTAGTARPSPTMEPASRWPASRSRRRRPGCRRTGRCCAAPGPRPARNRCCRPARCGFHRRRWPCGTSRRPPLPRRR